MWSISEVSQKSEQSGGVESREEFAPAPGPHPPPFAVGNARIKAVSCGKYHKKRPYACGLPAFVESSADRPQRGDDRDGPIRKPGCLVAPGFSRKSVSSCSQLLDTDFPTASQAKKRQVAPEGAFVPEIPVNEGPASNNRQGYTNQTLADYPLSVLLRI
jgi:hypothetical protein